MLFADKLKTAGEHSLTLEGKGHQLESKLLVPNEMKPNVVAILGHPHSLQGGTMNNKVVTTMARTFRELGVPSIRFNFRGVGASEGSYDNGHGESEDMIAITDLWLKEFPESLCYFAGFSFGSYVAYRAASYRKNKLLISIAPPVHHYDFLEFSPPPSPWLIVQGEEDEVTPAHLVYEFCEEVTPKPHLIRFEDTSHFFHGKLIRLKDELSAVIKAS